MKNLLGSSLGLFVISFAIFSGGVSYGAEAVDEANISVNSNLSTMDGPDPTQVYIKSISYGGTGCPQGSVGQSMASDRKSFTLIFDQFIASMGPGIPITESRKNCQLNIDLHIPNGWSYSIGTFDYRGYVQLPAGQTASQKSTYYFQGEVSQASGQTNFVGPVARDYLVRDTLGLNAIVWSACGATVPLNINSQIRLTGDGSKNGQITTDSIDGKVKHIMGLMWRRC